MIPDEHTIQTLWQTYALSDVKKHHSALVAKVALFLAAQLQKIHGITVDTPLLYAGAMLHDIDKNIPKEKGEHHPDTGVRILTREGYEEVADLIKTHSLSAILHQTIAPKTWEEKLLFLSDKMVKHEVITVDERFSLWRKEGLPQEAIKELDSTYPLVKALEKEIFDSIHMNPHDVSNILKTL